MYIDVSISIYFWFFMFLFLSFFIYFFSNFLLCFSCPLLFSSNTPRHSIRTYTHTHTHVHTHQPTHDEVQHYTPHPHITQLNRSMRRFVRWWRTLKVGLKSILPSLKSTKTRFCDCSALSWSVAISCSNFLSSTISQISS